jgi:hypothetical protein
MGLAVLLTGLMARVWKPARTASPAGIIH